MINNKKRRRKREEHNQFILEINESTDRQWRRGVEELVSQRKLIRSQQTA
jgi:hypothetical protein